MNKQTGLESRVLSPWFSGEELSLSGETASVLTADLRQSRVRTRVLPSLWGSLSGGSSSC